MQLFKAKDYLRSWSTWVFASLTTGAVLDHFTGIVTEVIPEQYKGIAVAVMSAIGLVVRAIKQK